MTRMLTAVTAVKKWILNKLALIAIGLIGAAMLMGLIIFIAATLFSMAYIASLFGL